MSDGLTENELLEAARRQGYKVSADQLKRWRRGELIPRPIQTHPTGRPGSEATYPAGTLTRLLVVCELRRRFKKLDRIRFELWWSGQYAGGMAPIRAFLITQLEGLLGKLREHRDRFSDPFQAAEAAIADSSFNSPHPGLRAMRRLVQEDEDLRSVAYAIFLDVFGGEVPWDHDTQSGLAILFELFGAEVVSEVGALEPSLRALVQRATGVERAKTDQLDSGEPLLSPDANIVETMRALNVQGMFDLDDPGWAIRNATDDQLEAARAQAHLLAHGLSMLARLVAAQYGRDHGGLGALSWVDPGNPTVAAVIVQLTLLLPSVMTTEEETTHLAQTLEALSANADRFACATLFLTELPEYEFLLKPDRDARLSSLTSEERKLIASTVNDFVTRHPECSFD